MIRNSSNPEVQAFLEARHPGFTLESAAKDLKVTPQALSQMLQRGMLLSSAEHIAHVYGYVLELDWPVKTYPNGYIPSQPKHEVKAKGNLRGLARYLRDAHLSANCVAKAAGVSPATLYHALATGNIRLSVLKRISDALGITPKWNWIEK